MAKKETMKDMLKRIAGIRRELEPKMYGRSKAWDKRDVSRTTDKHKSNREIRRQIDGGGFALYTSPILPSLAV